jgi:hypothetical protein
MQMFEVMSGMQYWRMFASGNYVSELLDSTVTHLKIHSHLSLWLKTVKGKWSIMYSFQNLLCCFAEAV